ncbi:SUMF1/EgtB/PvdO family nonheme iron enzyme [uncultured Roseobacter sp.]|uniref:SUMF1/EgtB/PvdO family nonheme iron enzyme n=1 Tax=uncultured Roseobacter sp. TaxID=114847 RepID=UPI0026258D80|nr:SUMF1/EgtB/PvdO family nonheme iron enzyme [uncultured Roseobacter sp.]
MIRRTITSFVFALWAANCGAEGLDEATIAPDQRSGVERLLHRAGFGGLQKSYAIVVGVSDFAEFPDLPTENDPIMMRDYLTNEAGFDYVHILTEEKVTKARLEELMLDEFRPMVGPNDRFLFYWSGHGETLELGSGQMGFLPLSDSRKASFSSMVAMSDLARWNRFISAHQVLFLLDSCFSGLAGGAPQSDLTNISRQQLSGPGRHLITAGRVNEQTIAVDDLGGSIFTHALLKGVRGAADSKNDLGADGLISVGELKAYLGQEVGRLRMAYNWQKTITPQIRDLSGSDGAFFFPLPAKFPAKQVDIAPKDGVQITPQSGDPDILEVQRSLIELGYDLGPPDGILGFSTRRALIAFQTKSGLDRTGEIDDATTLAILQALVPAPDDTPPDIATKDEDQPQTTISDGPGPPMVLIEGGRFVMGRNDGTPEEGPARDVTVAPFWVSTTETTMALFGQYVEEEGLDFVSRKIEAEPTCYEWSKDNRLRRTAYAYNQLQDTPDDDPVSCVNREDIDGFLEWLNRGGASPPYRLPTEAEFEYLLSRDNDRHGQMHVAADSFWVDNRAALVCDWGNFADASAPFNWTNRECSDGSPGVSAVASFEPDPNGLYDIRGNLWEWVSDCWRPRHKDPAPADCKTGTVRGASFDDPLKNLGSTVRQPVPLKRRQTNIGFRLARNTD